MSASETQVNVVHFNTVAYKQTHGVGKNQVLQSVSSSLEKTAQQEMSSYERISAVHTTRYSVFFLVELGVSSELSNFDA